MKKNRIIKIVVLIAIFAVWRLIFSSDNTQLQSVHLTGTTMGPIPFSIKYLDKDNRNFQMEVDSLLEVFNNSLSTYIPSSELSRFNMDDYFQYETSLMYPVLSASKEVFEKTGGAFDPTVGPLVNAWGFGPDKASEMDSARVDSLLIITGYDKVIFDATEATKIKGMYLDFSAIAKGNAIDVVVDFLKIMDIDNYMVEIGGEVMCKGKSLSGNLWTIGIQKPAMRGEEGELMAKVSIKDRAIATSGNYRNYYVEDGKIISHTISPFTGYPVSHNLLSASVFAKNCTLADAYATACMVVGFEKSKELITEIKGLDGFFIYTDDAGNYKTWASDGVKSNVELMY